MMNYIRIIPSLLLSKGKLIKGIQFKNYKNAGSPVTTITALDSQKSDEIFIIDLDCYKKKTKEPDINLLKKIAEVSSTPITFGGGVKNLEISKKVFSNGADKIFLNSILLKKKKIIKDISSLYGNQAIVGGLNIIKKKKKYYLLEDKTMKIDPIDYALELQNSGVGELKIIFVNLEGTKEGLDIEYSKKIQEKLKIPTIFEGGVGDLDQLTLCFSSGLKSIALGTMIIFSDYNIIKIKHHLKNKNFSIRL